MRFAHFAEMSLRLLGEKSCLMTAVLDEFAKYLATKDYGSSIATFFISIICVEAEFDPFHPVRPLKYSKKDKEFACDIKLDFESILNVDERRVKTIVGTAVLNSMKALRGKKIGDFDLPRFEEDLRSFLEKRGWLLSGTDASVDSSNPSATVDSPLEDDEAELSAPLAEDVFWSIIDESRTVIAPAIDTERQCESASEILSAMSEDQIVGFELALRDLLRRANHFNVMAACKICEDYVGDDNYLYFRAGLVSYGREVFYAAVENPDTCAEVIVLNTDGEYVLYVADNAFTKKFGSDTDKALPRDQASEYYNYDLDMEQPAGKDWTEEELPHRYPRLWQAARDRRSQPPGLKSNEH